MDANRRANLITETNKLLTELFGAATSDEGPHAVWEYKSGDESLKVIFDHSGDEMRCLPSISYPTPQPRTAGEVVFGDAHAFLKTDVRFKRLMVIGWCAEQG